MTFTTKTKFTFTLMIAALGLPATYALADQNQELISALEQKIDDIKKLCDSLPSGPSLDACKEGLNEAQAALDSLSPPARIGARTTNGLKLSINGENTLDYGINSNQSREGNIVTGGLHDNPASSSSSSYTFSLGGGIKEGSNGQAVSPIGSIKGGITTNKFIGTLDIVGGETVLRLSGTTQMLPIKLVDTIAWSNYDLNNLDIDSLTHLNAMGFKLQVVPVTAEGQMTFEKQPDKFGPTSYHFTLSPELQAQLNFTSLANGGAINATGATGFLPVTGMVELDAGPAVEIAHDSDGTAVAVGAKIGLSGQVLMGINHGNYIDFGALVQATPSIANILDEKLSFSARTKGWALYKHTFDSTGGSIFVGPEVEANVADVQKSNGSSAQGGAFAGTQVQGTLSLGYQGAILK